MICDYFFLIFVDYTFFLVYLCQKLKFFIFDKIII